MDSPYPRDAVERAFDVVRRWNATELQQHVGTEIGREVMGLFGALARSSYPDASDAERSKAVHLMVVAWLLRGQLSPAPAPSSAP